MLTAQCALSISACRTVPLTMFVNMAREKNATNCIMLETSRQKFQIIMCQIRQLVLTRVLFLICM